MKSINNACIQDIVHHYLYANIEIASFDSLLALASELDTLSVRPAGPKGRHVRFLSINAHVHADSLQSTLIINTILAKLPFLAAYQDSGKSNILQNSTVEWLSRHCRMLETLQLCIISCDLGVSFAINTLAQLHSLTIHHHAQDFPLLDLLFQHGICLPQL